MATVIAPPAARRTGRSFEEVRRPRVTRPGNDDPFGCDLWPEFIDGLPDTVAQRLKDRSFFKRQQGLPGKVHELLDWRVDGFTETGEFDEETLAAGLLWARLWMVRRAAKPLLELAAQHRAKAEAAGLESEQGKLSTELANEFYARAIALAQAPPQREIKTTGKVHTPRSRGDQALAITRDQLVGQQERLIAQANAIGLTDAIRSRLRGLLRAYEVPVPEGLHGDALRRWAELLDGFEAFLVKLGPTITVAEAVEEPATSGEDELRRLQDELRALQSTKPYRQMVGPHTDWSHWGAGRLRHAIEQITKAGGRPRSQAA